MKLDQLMLGLLIFGVFVAGAVFVVQDLNASYNLTMQTDEFNSTYNQINSLYNTSRDMEDQVINADISTTTSWESMMKGSYSAVRLVTAPVALISAIIDDLSKTLGVPAFIVTFLTTALLISVIWAIIYIIMRFIPR